MKYPDKIALVFDHGMYINVALKLSEDFGKVYYYTPWEGAFPKSNDTLPGFGYKEFERTDRFWGKGKSGYDFDKVDLFVFCDIYHSDLQNYLVSIGKNVWGARGGDAMEIYRWDFIQFMQKIGLPTPKSELVIGIDALRKRLKQNDDLFVKMDAKERGDCETFHHLNYDLTEPILVDMEYNLGAKAQIKKFILQEPIETNLETGYDGWCIDGSFPDTCIFGIEVKDKGYIAGARKYSEIPDGVRFVNDKLEAALKGYGYRGSFHTEVRIAKDGSPYLIDMTCRMGCPPISIMLNLVENIAEVMHEGSQGKIIEPVMKTKFGAEFLLYSDFANDHFYNILVPDSVKDSVTQSMSCVIDGKIYSIPQGWDSQCVCEVVSIGDDLDKTVSDLQGKVEKIQGLGMKCDADCLSDAVGVFRKM